MYLIFSSYDEKISYMPPPLDLHLKENLIRQTSFLRKNPSQKPVSFRVNYLRFVYVMHIQRTYLNQEVSLGKLHRGA